MNRTPRFFVPGRLFPVTLMLSLFSFSNIAARVFTVTRSDASGSGSLSWAVSQTRIFFGPDTVCFDIPRTDSNFDGHVWTIFIQSPLEDLSDDGTVIDGMSQTVHQGDTNIDGPEILLDGTKSTESVPAIRVTSSDNRICHIAIGGFPSAGIVLTGSETRRNEIKGCFIGTDARGRSPLANGASGITCTGSTSHNTIGGTKKGDRNIISGNGHYGILIEESCYNSIIGNYIGVDVTGLLPLPNGAFPKKYAGLFVSLNSSHNLIGNGTAAGCNIISGNYRTGIRLEHAGTDSNVVQGNYIGVGVDGRTPVANGEAGLLIGRGACANVIGGDGPGKSNVISGNHSSGVQFARASSDNLLKGNLIGTDATGILAIPNDHNGIYFYGNQTEGYPVSNVIGPGNIICANGKSPFSQYWAGISLDNVGTMDNICCGNFIGINPLTNLQAGQPTGVLIQRGAHDNTIGPNNVITNCAFDGVMVMHDSTINNKITQNRIFKNSGRAIHNVDGGNKNTHPPAITWAEKNQIRGFSTPRDHIELYSGEYGQAHTYLGETETDEGGSFEWYGEVDEPYVTALAIDSTGNTSELSGGSAVPVELLSFQAKQNEGDIVLLWCTTSETNNLGFWLQRRANGCDFDDIVFIPGSGTTTKQQTYGYKDRALKAEKYTYRLKQVDTDGRFRYLSEITVEVGRADVDFFAYPNPFNESIQITFSVAESQFISLRVFDMLGREVKTIWQGQQDAGPQTRHWNGRDSGSRPVASGEYFLVLQLKGETRVKKCLLAK